MSDTLDEPATVHAANYVVLDVARWQVKQWLHDFEQGVQHTLCALLNP